MVGGGYIVGLVKVGLLSMFLGLALSPVFSRFCLLLSMLVVGCVGCVVWWVCVLSQFGGGSRGGVCVGGLFGWGVWLAVVRWLAVGWIDGGGVLAWVVVVW